MSTHESPLQDAPHNATRRDFLAKTALAAGAAALLGGCASERGYSAGALGPARERAPLADGEPIRMGVIGTGGMGTAHCQSIMGLAKSGRCSVQIVAMADVCDPRVAHAQKVCQDTQGIDVATYRKHEELLARDDIHAVLIAAPEHWHGGIARDAILAGKDVYLEKPMCLRLDDALSLRRVVLANPQQVFTVGTQMIMIPKYQAAKKALAEGAIGKPTMSQTSYCRNSKDGEWLYYAIDPAWEPGVNLDWDRWCGPLGSAPWDPEVYARWRRYKKYSTGIIGDLLVHVMTPLMYALDMGWPTRVVASGAHMVDKKMENHDQVNLNIEFEGEHVMVVAGSTCNEVGFETLIRGHKANMYLGGRHCEIRPERLFADDVDRQTIECPDIGNDQDLLRLNFLECVRTRARPASDVDLGTKCMVAVDLATRSMWDGHAWAFDPKTMTARRA